MSLENEINRLKRAKTDIRASLKTKIGLDIPAETKLDKYGECINNVESTCPHINGDFYSLRTKNGTDYSYLFSNYNRTNLDYISNWDTSQVTNMYYMFDSCRNLITLDLSGWDTSKVTNMGYMFSNCSDLTSLDLSNWDTSKVTNMDHIFQYCGKLTTLDLSSWDTSKVTNMNSIFYNYYDMALRHIYGTLDLSGLTNGFYPGSYADPVKGCKNLETLYLKNIYKNCSMANASKWSINLGETVVKDECLIYIIDQLPDLINDKKLTTTTNIVLTLPKTNTLTEEQIAVAKNKGWQVANTTYDLPYYNVSYNLDENIITPTKQKAVANKRFALTLSTINDDYCFESVTVTMGDTTVKPIYIGNSDGYKTEAKIDIAKVTSDIIITASAKEIVRYTTFVVGVEDPSVNNILYIKGNVKEVFINGELQNLPDNGKYVVKDGDIIKINNSVVNNDSRLYFSSSTISSIRNVNLQSNVSDLSSMFSCVYLTSLDLSNFDTFNVTNMSSMFRSCSSLTSLDVSNFDTFNVTSMSSMFEGCSSLTSLDLSNFNTSNVTNMAYMFENCTSLTSLDLSSFNTRNITSYNAYVMMLFNAPSNCTIYINPLTFINKSTGKTFTPAELSWTGTFTERIVINPITPPIDPTDPDKPHPPA